MLMSMTILNDTVKLLSNINNGTNTLVINGTIVPESSWVGTGYYTVGNIRIAKISANTGNVHCVKVNDLNYKLVVKTNTQTIWAENVSYDNSVSGSAEDNCQGAIDDLYDKFKDCHPVGSLFFSVDNTNPATYFGGTWVRISQGRVIVGVDENDSDFNSAEKTSGNKTTNLYHSHSLSGHRHGLNSHTHTLLHNHGLSAGYAKLGGTGKSLAWRYKNGVPTYSTMWAVDGSWGGAWTSWNFSDGVELGGATDNNTAAYTTSAPNNTSVTAGPSTDNTDSKLSSTQSLLQPGLAVYIWKRTA